MEDSRPPKVFLSSTNHGLEALRKIARRVIKKLGCEAVVMEEFYSHPNPSDEVCQDAIRQSDIYVGLFGNRYGYIPPGSEHSITEREFRFAQIRGLPRLSFRLDGRLLDVEDPEKPQAEFLEHVQNDAVWSTVRTEGQLATALEASLTRALADEPWGMSHHLIGRRDLLVELRKRLLEDRDNVVLLGHSGVGKSELLNGFTEWGRREAARRGSQSPFRDTDLWGWALPDAEALAPGNDSLTPSDLKRFSGGEVPTAKLGRLTMASFGQQLREKLEKNRLTIALFDNVWPSQVAPLMELCAGLATQSRNVVFLFSTRLPEVHDLIQQAGRISSFELPVEPLAVPETALDLLVWRVAGALPTGRGSARSELHQLKDVLRPLALATSGYPKVIEIAAGLVVEAGGTIPALRSSATRLEQELLSLPSPVETADYRHRTEQLDSICSTLLSSWLGKLGTDTRNVLAVCSVLPPAPAVHSMDAIKLHWKAAVAAGLFRRADQRDIPALYEVDEDEEGPAAKALEDALEREVDLLRQAQLLTGADQPVGRSSPRPRRHAGPRFGARNRPSHYKVHAIVSQYFRADLLGKRGDLRAVHGAAIDAISDALETGPLLTFRGMFDIEEATWQGLIGCLVHHLAHLAALGGSDKQQREDLTSVRFRIFSLYLDSFWWWGYYVRYPFCDWLVDMGGRIRVPEREVEDHTAFLRSLRHVDDIYPRSWQKERAGADWDVVEAGLRRAAKLSGIDLAEDIKRIADERTLHVRGLLHVFFAHCNWLREPKGPSNDEFRDAMTNYRTALAAFKRRAGKPFTSVADEWNEAWVEYEKGDLLSVMGRPEQASQACDRAWTLEERRIRRTKARGETDYALQETLADVERVRADLAEKAGDLVAEAGHRSLAAFHAFAFQVLPPQAERKPKAEGGGFKAGPDDYTQRFYEEMRDRAVYRIEDLVREGEVTEACARAAAHARFFGRSREPAVARVLDRLAGKKAGSDASSLHRPLVKAIFPPSGDEAGGNRDAYIRDGRRLVWRIADREVRRARRDGGSGDGWRDLLRP